MARGRHRQRHKITLFLLIFFNASGCVECWPSESESLTQQLIATRYQPPFEIPHILSKNLDKRFSLKLRTGFFSSKLLLSMSLGLSVTKTSDGKVVHVQGFDITSERELNAIIRGQNIVDLTSYDASCSHVNYMFDSPGVVFCMDCLDYVDNDTYKPCLRSKAFWFDTVLERANILELSARNVPQGCETPESAVSRNIGISYLGEPVIFVDCCEPAKHPGEDLQCTKAYLHLTTLGPVRITEAEATKMVGDRKPLKEMELFK